MSLNRLFSDTIYQLMWDTKKSEKILIPRPRRGPTLDIKILRLDAEGTTFRFKTETKCNNYE